MTFTQKSLGDILKGMGPYTEEAREIRIGALLAKTNPKSHAFSETVRDCLIKHAKAFVLDAEQTDYVSGRVADITIAFGISIWDIVMNLHKGKTELPLLHRLYRGAHEYVLRVEAHPSHCIDPTLDFPTKPNDPNDRLLYEMAWCLDHSNSFEVAQDKYRQAISIHVRNNGPVENTSSF